MTKTALDDKTVGQYLESNRKQYGDREAIVYFDQGVRWSWKQLAENVDSVAKSLLALGIEKGDSVAVWGTNRPFWLLTQFASAKIGAALVTINPEWQSHELQYALGQSDTKCLLMLDGFAKEGKSKTHRYDYWETLCKENPELRNHKDKDLDLEKLPELRSIVLVAERQEPSTYSWGDFLDLGQEVSDESLDSAVHRVENSDTVLIQYTSGTTGFPKGAMLSHYNVVNNARIAAGNMKLTHQDRLCGPVPYYHCFGSILVNLCSLVSGATMVIAHEFFNAHATLECVEKEKCTALHGVPTMFTDEIDDQAVSRFDLSSLRTGIMAGAPCPVELMDAVMNKMGEKYITIGYGLTEASPLTHQTLPEDSIERRTSTVGKPLTHTEAKVVDPFTMKEVTLGEVGEIWVKGFHVMKGYYKKPEETEKAIVDGWLRTGDLGTKDGDGYFKIVGRLKEMFIVGGHNVYPAEVEQGLLNLLSDEVEEIQVLGLPHPRLQEVAAAVIRLRPGKRLDEKEIRARCEGKMEWPKIPRYIDFVEDYSPFMTVTGKIQKFKLQDYLRKKFKLTA